MGLPGWVNNSTQGVLIEVEGGTPDLDTFLQRIQHEKPPLASIRKLESTQLPVIGLTSFAIHPSDCSGQKSAFILPDIATCPDCQRELFDPTNRRYRYPFINCTNCGPRFSIIEALPYDRPNTTMKHFELCEACRTEYEDPLDRRFHAQPNACPVCGPHLELWTQQGNVLATHHHALLEAVSAIRQGQIVALKGLGGFHLVADAGNDEAIQRLRQLKHRDGKPFATMFPSLALVSDYCDVSMEAAALLTSPAAPIVILPCRTHDKLAVALAPAHPTLGVMLPYTPLHHLLMTELGFPIVATSGNQSDEPICIDEEEALQRLATIADVFLVHNRPIKRPVDDSVTRIVAARPMMLRRARGYAPLPIQVEETLPPTLAVGAHQKNTIALATGHEIFVSQHIGDLDTLQTNSAFRQVIGDFESMYELQPLSIACDLHPDYRSTQFAETAGLPILHVQHHYAHVLACMAENQVKAPALGICWDGTGYGSDGTIWGGEFLSITPHSFERMAHFRTFALPGGDQAIKEPRRTALSLLYEIFGDEAFSMQIPLLQSFTCAELALMRQILHKKINAPRTSSAGRLFDAVAAILGLSRKASFEGQAAIALEFAIRDSKTDNRYPFGLIPSPDAQDSAAHPSQSENALVIDWEPMIRCILRDQQLGISLAEVAAKFHNTLVQICLAVAQKTGLPQVVLTGGCFQNKYLTEHAITALQQQGFQPHIHRQLPPNDGGIALGQIMAMLRESKGKE